MEKPIKEIADLQEQKEVIIEDMKQLQAKYFDAAKRFFDLQNKQLYIRAGLKEGDNTQETLDEAGFKKLRLYQLPIAGPEHILKALKRGAVRNG